MKRILLLSVFCLLVSLFAKTQTIPQFDKAKPTENIVLYLFNLDNGGFLVGDNRWNTQASLSQEKGSKVKLKRYFDKTGKWDGKTFFITDSVTTGFNVTGGYRNVFIEHNEGIVYVDQHEVKTPGFDNLWVLEKADSTDENVFHIKISDNNKVYTPVNYGDASLSVLTLSLIPEVGLKRVNGFMKADCWCFMTQETYDRFVVEYEIYRKRLLLNKLIHDVESFPKVDVKEARQVCDNDGTTPSLLNLQIGNMRAVLMKEGDTTDKEIDFTELIASPQFEYGIGWNKVYGQNLGQVYVNGGGGLRRNPVFEAWQCSFDFSQTITGIPDGLYRIDAQAFYRPATIGETEQENGMSFIDSELYAEDMAVPVHNILDCQVDNPSLEEGKTRKLSNGNTVVDDIFAVSEIFLRGMYDQSVYCMVSNGELSLGIRQTDIYTDCWTAWDNFRLTYLPETIENYAKALENHIPLMEKEIQIGKRRNLDSSVLEDCLKDMKAVLKKKTGTAEMRSCLSVANSQLSDFRNLQRKNPQPRQADLEREAKNRIYQNYLKLNNSYGTNLHTANKPVKKTHEKPKKVAQTQSPGPDNIIQQPPKKKMKEAQDKQSDNPLVLDNTTGKEKKTTASSKPVYVERPFSVELTAKDPDLFSDVRGVATYHVKVNYKGNDPNAYIILEGNRYNIGKNKTISKTFSFTLKKDEIRNVVHHLRCVDIYQDYRITSNTLKLKHRSLMDL